MHIHVSLYAALVVSVVACGDVNSITTNYTSGSDGGGVGADGGGGGGGGGSSGGGSSGGGSDGGGGGGGGGGGTGGGGGNDGGSDGGSDGGVDAPPIDTGTITFATASSSASEFSISPAPLTITLTRTGQDLTMAATATIAIDAGSSTAMTGTHYVLDVGSTLGTIGSHVYTFPAQAAGVTSQQISFSVTPKYARRPAGTQTQLVLDVTAATSANVASPPPRHVVTFVGAGDRAFNGEAIPEFVAPGTFAGTTACESFIASNLLGAPVPGTGQLNPCGSYDLALSMHPDYERCNAGMLNTTSRYDGVGDVVNTVQRARMFVNEDITMTSTYFGGNSMRYSQHQNDAFIMKFRTGGAGDYPANVSLPPGAIGALQFTWVEHVSQGQSGIRFAALSTNPCDFDYAKLDANNRCYVGLSIQGGGNIYAQIVPAGVNASPGYCALAPNTTYYLSTRWENPSVPTRGQIACKAVPGTSTGQYCGTNFDFR